MNRDNIITEGLLDDIKNFFKKRRNVKMRQAIADDPKIKSKIGEFNKAMRGIEAYAKRNDIDWNFEPLTLKNLSK